jgi:hypothetical protein
MIGINSARVVGYSSWHCTVYPYFVYFRAYRAIILHLVFIILESHPLLSITFFPLYNLIFSFMLDSRFLRLCVIISIFKD